MSTVTLTRAELIVLRALCAPGVRWHLPSVLIHKTRLCPAAIRRALRGLYERGYAVGPRDQEWSATPMGEDAVRAFESVAVAA
jgi:hypothetical protein